jgi:hypothetical protein
MLLLLEELLFTQTTLDNAGHKNQAGPWTHTQTLNTPRLKHMRQRTQHAPFTGFGKNLVSARP